MEKARAILEGENYRVNDIDGVRVEFEDGWGLLRPSNTQPVLVMRFEAGTREKLQEYEKLIRKILNRAREEM